MCSYTETAKRWGLDLTHLITQLHHILMYAWANREVLVTPWGVHCDSYLGLRSTYVGLPPGKVDEYIHGGNRTFVELSTFASGSNVPSSMDMKPYEAV